MKIQEIVKLIDSTDLKKPCHSSAKLKVYFNPHDPRHVMIGKFVWIKDSADLAKKGFIRFVNDNKLDYWNDMAPEVGKTKLYQVSDFSQIKPLL